MVLDSQRDNVDPLLTKFAKIFKKINPNALTWLALFFSIVAGTFFYFSKPETELNTFYLYFAALFVFLNGFFDAVDGKVAKLTGKTSAQGDFLDHALDRYADVFIVGGLALNMGWIPHPEIGFLAIVGMLLTSYMGTQSQAVGCKRNYSGLLGRADRLVLLMFAPVIQHILLNFYGVELIYGFTLLECVLIYFAIVGNLTAIQRFLSTMLWFDKRKN